MPSQLMQTAVFVDAGYIYAQGSALIAGSRQPRTLIRLDIPRLLAALRDEADRVEPRARLLRIYWYDGLPRGGAMSRDQRVIAESDDVKCRFGTINSQGEQKGVDALVIADLIELSRSHAISDALVLSGDEDLRAGIVLAQTAGVRAHLLSLGPPADSVSPDLQAEVDTRAAWDVADVSRWLEVAQLDAEIEQAVAGDWLARAIGERLATIDYRDAIEIHDYALDNRNTLPGPFDRPSLAIAGRYAGRELSADEKRLFRGALLGAVREKVLAGPV